MENGTDISRNCIDLKWTDALFETQPHPVMSKIAKSRHAPSHNTIPCSTANIKHSDKANLIKERVEIRKSNLYTMQSGCISKPATRLIDQM